MGREVVFVFGRCLWFQHTRRFCLADLNQDVVESFVDLSLPSKSCLSIPSVLDAEKSFSRDVLASLCQRFTTSLESSGYLSASCPRAAAFDAGVGKCDKGDGDDPLNKASAPCPWYIVWSLNGVEPCRYPPTGQEP